MARAALSALTFAAPILATPTCPPAQMDCWRACSTLSASAARSFATTSWPRPAFTAYSAAGASMDQALSPEQAVADGPDTGEHGIQFICLAANISRQFEFVQNAWVMSTKFNAMTEESDPLLGNRAAVPGCPFTNTFSIPQQSGVRARITDLPQFITVRGGAYFFLPEPERAALSGRTRQLTHTSARCDAQTQLTAVLPAPQEVERLRRGGRVGGHRQRTLFPPWRVVRECQHNCAGSKRRHRAFAG